MKVAIDALSHIAGGQTTYLQNLISRFSDDGNEYVVVLPADAGPLTPVETPNVRYYETNVPKDALPRRFVYQQTVLPYRLRQWDVDVLLSPADVTTLATRVPRVLVVHNLGPYSVGEFDRPLGTRLKLWVQKRVTALSARSAESVVFVSETSRRRICSHLDVPAAKQAVVHHGVDHEAFGDPDPPGDPELRRTVDRLAPYLLTVSTVNEHKNYETLLRGYAALPPAVRERYPLLIVGRLVSEPYHRKLRAILTEEGIGDQVSFLGEVPHDDLPWVYENAVAYVFPSTLETFGLTVLEAMASGCPVVAADTDVVREITGDAAVRFDPTSSASLTRALRETLGDEKRLTTLTSRGRDRASSFRWEDAAAELRDLLVAAGDP